MRSREAALLLSALALPALGSCVSDLSVGLVALENEDQGAAASDGGTDGRRDAAGPDAARDGGRADAAAARDGMSSEPPLDARVDDARVVDADSSRDAACDDGRCDGAVDGGAVEDAARGDASSSRDARVSDAAGTPCAPSECDSVGVRLNETPLCDDGTPMLCVRNQNGVCDYACD